MSDMLKNAGFMSAADMHEEYRPIPKAKPEPKKEDNFCMKCNRYRPLANNFAFCVTCSALMAKGDDRQERLTKLGLTEAEAIEKVGWEPVVVDWPVK